VKELKVQIPKGTSFNWVQFIDENSIMYEIFNGSYAIYVYDIETEKSIFISKSDIFETKVKILGNGNIAIYGTQKLTILDKSSYKVVKEVKYPFDIGYLQSISMNGEKLAYITNNGLYVSDLDFKNPQYLFASELNITKNDGRFYLNSVEWMTGDKKILYSFGAHEEPLGIGAINPDGSDNLLLFTGSESNESLSDGVSILHENYLINTYSKEISVLPCKIIDHSYSDDYSNCSPKLERLVHRSSGENISESGDDIWSVIDFSNQLEYILPKVEGFYGNYHHIYAWSPSSKKILYEDSDEEWTWLFFVDVK
jgi:hypothetical protein